MKIKQGKPPGGSVLKQTMAGLVVGLAALWCGAASSPPPVTANSGGGSAATQVSGDWPDTWLVKIPLLGAEFWATFEHFAGVLLVETMYADGQPGGIAIGMEYGTTIFWMDITGTIFIGSMDRDAGTAMGLVFGYQGASSVWFAERVRPDVVDLHHLLYRGLIRAPTSAPYGTSGGSHSCITCHAVDTGSGDWEFIVERECQVCHGD